eukprot:TRINITY_DN4997_c0_g1_i1.p1 TRINITY_DN4997_c0_g1~~TRINITY_DN4997_c0_g1_i1.p1  ORF type:complete len:764 (-),score=183.00 TRINITY_DN4997_c0_g1_i1:33-2324(-)
MLKGIVNNITTTVMSDSHNIQIIDAEGVFNEEIKQKMIDWDVYNAGFKYFLVAILGAQSSGKSTLLNHLFGTDFIVMNQHVRTRTTEGIWAGKVGNNNHNLLIFDVEGTDSRERKDENGLFERKSSLFSLALSEVLIVNIWETNIGRYQGAGFSLLSIVFDMNLRLFLTTSVSKTLLMFAIRCHNPESDLNQLIGILMEDMEDIWEGCNKPDKFADSSLHDFFDFEFIPFADFKASDEKKEIFLGQIEDLKSRFLDTEGEQFQQLRTYKKSIPADGLPDYMRNIWKIIDEEQDLNLPSQRRLLAGYRCDEMMKDALNSFLESVEELKSTVQNGKIVLEFGNILSTNVEKYLEEYDTHAKRYELEVYEEKRNELYTRLNAFCKELFGTLVLLIQTSTIQNFKKDVHLLLGDQHKLVENFGSKMKRVYEKTLSDYEEKLHLCEVDVFNWSLVNEIEYVNNILNDTVQRERENQLSLLYSEVKEQLQMKFTTQLTRPFKDSKEDMWEEIGVFFGKKEEEIINEYTNHLIDFGCTEEEIVEKTKSVDDIARGAIKDSVTKFASRLGDHMDRKFAELFNEDKGISRRWGDYSENEITQFYKTAIYETERMVNLFSILRIDESDLELSFFEYENEQLRFSEDIPDISRDLIVIDPQESLDLLDSFRAKAKREYQSAQDERENAKYRGGVPKIFWAILLILGANEMYLVGYMIIFNPFLLFLFTLIFGGAFIIYYFGLWPLLEPMVYSKIRDVRGMVEENIPGMAKEKTE